MPRSLPLLSAIVLVAAAGAFNGLRTSRWSVSRELTEAVEVPARLPLSIGDWEGKDERLDDRELAMAGIGGYVMRRYVNRRDGSMASILLVCGRPGPISVHTPDVCYSGGGYALEAEQVRVTPVGGPSPEAPTFWRGDFLKQGAAVPSRLRIHWAWNNGGGWKAPDHPRLTFAPSPFLYKLYVIHESVDSAAGAGPDRGAEFLGALLPALDGVLGGPAGGEQGGSAS